MDRHLFSEVKRNRSCESVIGCKWTAVLVRFGGNFSLSHCVHFCVVRTCSNISSPCAYVLSFKVQHSASNGKEWNCVPNSDHAWFYTIRCDATIRTTESTWSTQGISKSQRYYIREGRRGQTDPTIESLGRLQPSDAPKTADIGPQRAISLRFLM